MIHNHGDRKSPKYQVVGPLPNSLPGLIPKAGHCHLEIFHVENEHEKQHPAVESLDVPYGWMSREEVRING